MKVLVTGANGFLGQWYMRELLRQGHDVLGIDDLSGSNKEVPPDLHGDVRIDDVIDYVEDGGERFDLAVHLAAPVGGRLKIDGDPMFNAHSLSIDAHFFRWAIGNVTSVLYPSSSAVYGEILQKDDSSMALREVDYSPAHAEWLRPDQMYGFTKLAGEFLAWKSAEYGLRTLCIRPFSGYGPGQSFDYPVPSLAARALRKEDPLVVWGSGHQKRDFIFVKDLVAMSLHAMTQDWKGYQRLNLGSGHPVSFVEVARLLADICGYRPEIVTDETKPQGVMTRYADTTQMKRLVGYPEITLVTGLAQVLEDVKGRL